MKYFTKKELIEALKDFNDNDSIVVEIHEGERSEDLYPFEVDHIEVTETYNEIRICI